MFCERHKKKVYQFCFALFVLLEDSSVFQNAKKRVFQKLVFIPIGIVLFESCSVSALRKTNMTHTHELSWEAGEWGFVEWGR